MGQEDKQVGLSWVGTCPYETKETNEQEEERNGGEESRDEQESQGQNIRGGLTR